MGLIVIVLTVLSAVFGIATIILSIYIHRHPRNPRGKLACRLVAMTDLEELLETLQAGTGSRKK